MWRLDAIRIGLLLIGIYIPLAESGFARVPEPILAYAVEIHRADGNSASGFFARYEDRIYLVTARHVIIDESNSLQTEALHVNAFYGKPSRDFRTTIQIPLLALNRRGLVHAHADANAAAIEIGAIAGEGDGVEVSIDYAEGVELDGPGITIVPPGIMRTIRTLRQGDPILVGGFPDILKEWMAGEGGRLPSIREGIVAGLDVDGPALVLDCQIDRGNCGGPVVQKIAQPDGSTSFSLVGLISHSVPGEDSSEQAISTGYCMVVPMDTLLQLMQEKEHSLLSIVDSTIAIRGIQGSDIFFPTKRRSNL